MQVVAVELEVIEPLDVLHQVQQEDLQSLLYQVLLMTLQLAVVVQVVVAAVLRALIQFLITRVVQLLPLQVVVALHLIKEVVV